MEYHQKSCTAQKSRMCQKRQKGGVAAQETSLTAQRVAQGAHTIDFEAEKQLLVSYFTHFSNITISRAGLKTPLIKPQYPPPLQTTCEYASQSSHTPLPIHYTATRRYLTMLVEEVPKMAQTQSSTVYFSSLINLTARPSSRHLTPFDRSTPDLEEAQSGRGGKSRPKVNYNLNDLMNAQTQTVETPASKGPLKSAHQVQLEKIMTKRLTELTKDTTPFELPKGYAYQSIHSNSADKKLSRLGNTPSTKKILAARRNLSLYFEEERNLLSINLILQVNYQFVDNTPEKPKMKKKKTGLTYPRRTFKLRLRLCCICGDQSNYSRCSLCGLFSCSVRCNRFHNELRCI